MRSLKELEARKKEIGSKTLLQLSLDEINEYYAVDDLINLIKRNPVGYNFLRILRLINKKNETRRTTAKFEVHKFSQKEI